MNTHIVGNIVKNSVVYGYAISQPFSIYMDMFPMVQNQLEKDEALLQYGESNEIVEHLQLTLNNLGYYDDEIDGYYGIYTEHALKQFQSSNHINKTGKADEETIKTLIENEKKEMLKSISEDLNSIQYGEKSDRVKNVQQVLYYLSYYEGKIDGSHGPLTDKAIQKAKQQNDFLTPQIIPTESNKNITIDPIEKVIEIPKLEKSNHHNKIINQAKNYMGIPYVWGGSSPKQGFDCSGFIQYVYKQENKVIPRTVSDIWNFASSTNAPTVGDLVFFETYKAGPSHLGIYVGENSFIHAGTSTGVTISNLSESYWKNRYIGAKTIQ